MEAAGDSGMSGVVSPVGGKGADAVSLWREFAAVEPVGRLWLLHHAMFLAAMMGFATPLDSVADVIGAAVVVWAAGSLCALGCLAGFRRWYESGRWWWVIPAGVLAAPAVVIAVRLWRFSGSAQDWFDCLPVAAGMLGVCLLQGMVPRGEAMEAVGDADWYSGIGRLWLLVFGLGSAVLVFVRWNQDLVWAGSVSPMSVVALAWLLMLGGTLASFPWPRLALALGVVVSLGFVWPWRCRVFYDESFGSGMMAGLWGWAFAIPAVVEGVSSVDFLYSLSPGISFLQFDYSTLQIRWSAVDVFMRLSTYSGFHLSGIVPLLVCLWLGAGVRRRVVRWLLAAPVGVVVFVCVAARAPVFGHGSFSGPLFDSGAGNWVWLWKSVWVSVAMVGLGLAAPVRRERLAALPAGLARRVRWLLLFLGMSAAISVALAAGLCAAVRWGQRGTPGPAPDREASATAGRIIEGGFGFPGAWDQKYSECAELERSLIGVPELITLLGKGKSSRSDELPLSDENLMGMDYNVMLGGGWSFGMVTEKDSVWTGLKDGTKGAGEVHAELVSRWSAQQSAMREVARLHGRVLAPYRPEGEVKDHLYEVFQALEDLVKLESCLGMLSLAEGDVAAALDSTSTTLRFIAASDRLFPGGYNPGRKDAFMLLGRVVDGLGCSTDTLRRQGWIEQAGRVVDVGSSEFFVTGDWSRLWMPFETDGAPDPRAWPLRVFLWGNIQAGTIGGIPLVTHFDCLIQYHWARARIRILEYRMKTGRFPAAWDEVERELGHERADEILDLLDAKFSTYLTLTPLPGDRLDVRWEMPNSATLAPGVPATPGSPRMKMTAVLCGFGDREGEAAKEIGQNGNEDVQRVDKDVKASDKVGEMGNEVEAGR